MNYALPSLFALASVVQAILPNNVVTPSTSGSLSAIKYTNVGGSGTYNQVTSMIKGSWPSCTANPSCITTPKQVSGPLAPFNEEMTAVLRGPMTLHNIAVYQPSVNSSSATWKRTSLWQQNSAPDNLVFMNNKGGGASGEWDIGDTIACGGNSQSFANGAFTDAVGSPNAEVHNGNLPNGNEVNIVTATSCTDVPCDGFARGTASHGWAGSKAFVFEFEMPSDGSSTPPAIWLLNQQVVNAAQYGCNCRGMGGQGGCGELDVFEVLPNNLNQGISEIYSFKGATGGGDGNFFARPTGGVVTYMAILDMQTDSIAIQRLSSWDFGQAAMTRSIVDGYLGVPSKLVSFAAGNKRRSERPKFMHRRTMH
ncbi:putative TOS1-like glycosyl hydrolase-domain-containing protein [Cristinia sonorae]|uniref:glucan endo-1,3-beta-D-glucosidase n=1 Tax=Cristinia sonorae TaxID=1940300 RepID=A0A8K0UVE1_9AGAR|nr:putative TOS1-like glycosyl hydrolase-domain-containing protein [Cristinia sonorae]